MTKSTSGTKYFISVHFLILFLFFAHTIHAQTVNPGINFQAIARDRENNAANNRKIYIEWFIGY